MICGVALYVDGGGLFGWMNNDKYEQKREEEVISIYSKEIR